MMLAKGSNSFDACSSNLILLDIYVNIVSYHVSPGIDSQGSG